MMDDRNQDAGPAIVRFVIGQPKVLEPLVNGTHCLDDRQ